jgi:topoisomerase-4 subunit B
MKNKKAAEFSAGNLVRRRNYRHYQTKGTKVIFTPDETIFKNYKFRMEYVVKMIQNYCYLNNGLTIILMAKNTILKTDLKIY